MYFRDTNARWNTNDDNIRKTTKYWRKYIYFDTFGGAALRVAASLCLPLFCYLTLH